MSKTTKGNDRQYEINELIHQVQIKAEALRQDLDMGTAQAFGHLDKANKKQVALLRAALGSDDTHLDWNKVIKN